MNWHRTPKDDGWKRAHLAMLVRNRSKLSLICGGCMHWRTMDPKAFADQHGLDLETPLLTIAKALKCERCGARKATAGPAPHDIYNQQRQNPSRSSTNDFKS